MRSVLTALAILSSMTSALAADYYVVVPVKGRTATLNAPAINVTLSSATLPDAVLGQDYSYNLLDHVVVTGDANLDLTQATLTTNDALPSGLSLAANGLLSGNPSVFNEQGDNFYVSALYKGKTGTQAYNLKVVAPADPYFSKVGLLLPLNQNLTDYSINPSGGITGSVAYGTQAPYGNHALFTGSQVIKVPYNAKIDFSKEVDFTLEMRVKLDAPVTGWTSLYTQVEPLGGFRPISIDLSPSGQLTASFGNSGLTGWGLSISAPTALPVGAWQTLAVSKQANTVRVFVNGSMVASGTYSGPLASWNGDYLIGAGQIGSNLYYPLKGAIDEVRVTRGVARMTGTYSVQSYPFSTH